MISSALELWLPETREAGPGGHFPLVNRALEPAFQDRSVDFPQLLLALFIFHADDNPVGMEKVANRSTLSQKLWIRRDRKGHAGCGA